MRNLLRWEVLLTSGIRLGICLHLFVRHYPAWHENEIFLALCLLPTIMVDLSIWQGASRFDLKAESGAKAQVQVLVLLGSVLGLFALIAALSAGAHSAPSLMLAGAYVQALFFWWAARGIRKHADPEVGP